MIIYFAGKCSNGRISLNLHGRVREGGEEEWGERAGGDGWQTGGVMDYDEKDEQMKGDGEDRAGDGEEEWRESLRTLWDPHQTRLSQLHRKY